MSPCANGSSEPRHAGGKHLVGGAHDWDWCGTSAHGAAPAVSICHPPSHQNPSRQLVGEVSHSAAGHLVCSLFPLQHLTGIWSRQWPDELPIPFFQPRTGHSAVQGSPGPRPSWRKHYFLVRFGGEDDHRAPLLRLLHPLPILAEMQVASAPLCKNVPFCSSSPLQRRNARKGGSYISSINVIKRIKLLERVSFSFSFYLIREIPTARFVQMKPRLLSVVRWPREDVLPFNLAH